MTKPISNTPPMANASPPLIDFSDASSIVNYAKDHNNNPFSDTFSAVQANPQDQTAVNAYVQQLFDLATFDSHDSGQYLDLQSVKDAATAALQGAGVEQGIIDTAEQQASGSGG